MGRQPSWSHCFPSSQSLRSRLAVGHRFDQGVDVKAEVAVALRAGPHVVIAGDTELALLVHDVDEHLSAAHLAGLDPLDRQHQFLLVVEAGESLVAVERQFVFGGDIPYRDGNLAAFLRLDGEVGAGHAPFEHEPVILDFRGADDPCRRAAHQHLPDVEVAPVGDVVSFFHDSFLLGLSLKALSASTTLRPPERSKGGLWLCPSSGAPASEGCVTVKALGQEVSCGLELVADEAEPQEPSPHGVFGVLVLLGLGAGGADFLRHLAEREAKLDVTLKLPCVEAVLLAVCRSVELEKPELDGAFGESGVEVQHMVAAAVVVLAPAVVLALAAVPDVRKLRHRAGLFAVQLVEEPRVDRAAVVAHAAAVKVKGIRQEVFVARHDVGEVAEGLRGVSLRSDVDVDSASSGGVALCSGVAKLADEFLQGVHVLVGEDRGDHLALLAVGSGDADVPLEFPLAALAVPGAPTVVSVAAGGVLVPACAEVGGGDLGGAAALDVVHLDLDSDGLLLHFLDLSCCSFAHCCFLRFRCVPQGVFPFGVHIFALKEDNSKAISRNILHKDDRKILCSLWLFTTTGCACDLSAQVLAVGNGQSAARVPCYQDRADVVHTLDCAEGADGRRLDVVHLHQLHPCAGRKLPAEPLDDLFRRKRHRQHLLCDRS